MHLDADSKRHLVVDLDGTLIKTDLFLETLAAAIRKDPRTALRFPFWLLQSRLLAKQKLASLIGDDFPISSLPYRQKVISLIQASKAAGATTVLASASDQRLVERVASHLGFFDLAIGSTRINLKGQNKLTELNQHLASNHFAYIGDSWADMDVWKGAKEAIAVNPSERVRRALQRLPIPVTEITDETSKWRSLIKALRIHQWSKNLLVMVPLVTAHKFYALSAWLEAAAAFAAFSLTASAVYLVNDILDIHADRKHPTKCHRPFASGSLPITWGFIAAPVLAVLAFLLATTLSPFFGICLCAYAIINGLYSLHLKKIFVADIVVLAILYTLRIVAGGWATNTPVSQWLLAFSVFFFFGLACLKRYTELWRLKLMGEEVTRGYRVSDLPIISSFGIVSSFISCVVFVLYLNSPAAAKLYANRDILWLVTPLLLYWVTRIWLLGSRGEVDDDPVAFTLKDKVSWATLLVLATLLLLAC